MVGARRLLRLEIDLARPSRDGDPSSPGNAGDSHGENGVGPAILLWPKSPIQPPDVPDAIVVSVDGELVRLRPPGARLSEIAEVGEWRVVRGSRIRVTWGTSVHEIGASDPPEPARGAVGVAHIEIESRGGPIRRFALPTIPGTRVTVGGRSEGADVPIEDSIAQRVVCRITFDGRDYRADSQDAAAMVRVNGAEVFWPATLASDDEISVGLATVRFLTGAPAGPLEVVQPPPEVASPPARVKRPTSISSDRAWMKPALAAGVIGAAAIVIVGFLIYAASLL